MKPIKVIYSRTYQVEQFEPEGLTIEVELAPGDDINSAFEACKYYVEANRTKR